MSSARLRRAAVSWTLAAGMLTCAPVGAIAAPDLIHHASSVVEAPPTDGDGVVEPGESFTLSETLQNRGDATATAITGALTTPSPDISLTQNASAYPNLPAGATGANSTPLTGHLSSTDRCEATLHR